MPKNFRTVYSFLRSSFCATVWANARTDGLCRPIMTMSSTFKDYANHCPLSVMHEQCSARFLVWNILQVVEIKNIMKLEV